YQRNDDPAQHPTPRIAQIRPPVEVGVQRNQPWQKQTNWGLIAKCIFTIPFRRLGPMLNCRSMKLSARWLPAVLVLGIGSLAPVLPDYSDQLPQQNTHCCADMNMDSSYSCPIDRG